MKHKSKLSLHVANLLKKHGGGIQTMISMLVPNKSLMCNIEQSDHELSENKAYSINGRIDPYF